MNAFDPLSWTLLAWLIVDLIQTGNQRLWIDYFVGVGFLFSVPGRRYSILGWAF
jgi:hypothetical protein